MTDSDTITCEYVTDTAKGDEGIGHTDAEVLEPVDHADHHLVSCEAEATRTIRHKKGHLGSGRPRQVVCNAHGAYLVSECPVNWEFGAMDPEQVIELRER